MIASLNWEDDFPQGIIIFHLGSCSFLSAGAAEESINARDQVGYPCTPIFFLEISKQQSKDAASPAVIVHNHQEMSRL